MCCDHPVDLRKLTLHKRTLYVSSVTSQFPITKDNSMRFVHSLMLASIFVSTTVSQAHAYIDPGSGSVLTTAIIGFFAVIAYTFRKYFYRLKDMVSGRQKPGQTH